MIPPETRYARACKPNGWRVLGLALQPFCLSHLLALQRIESPLLSGGGSTIEDLTRGVWICSGREPHGILYTVWTVYICVRIGLQPWLALSRSLYMRAYISDAMEIPDVLIKAADERSLTLHAPTAIVLLHALMSVGYSAEEVLHLPYQRITWEYYAGLERAGLLSFMSDDDRAMIEAARNHGKAI